MTIINNQRPGVYSRYDVSSAYTTPRSMQYAAVVAKATSGETGVLHSFTNYAQLIEAFSPDTEQTALRGCVQILLQSGVSRVYAVAVEDGGYEAALALVEEIDGIGAVVCDAAAQADLNVLKTSVLASSEAQRERVAYCAAGANSAEDAALALNCERVVLCCPEVKQSGGSVAHAVYSAAAIAGMALAKGDPAWNFSGEELTTVEDPAAIAESGIQTLLAAGVTVIENSGSRTECVRALTTCTQISGETNYTLRALNTILCIDDVMSAMRSALKATLRRRISGNSLDAIRSQAAVVLADKKADGIIEEYEAPQVSIHSEDPTVCVVELAFHVAHVISQIYVSAHIQV